MHAPYRRDDYGVPDLTEDLKTEALRVVNQALQRLGESAYFLEDARIRLEVGEAMEHSRFRGYQIAWLSQEECRRVQERCTGDRAHGWMIIQVHDSIEKLFVGTCFVAHQY